MIERRAEQCNDISDSGRQFMTSKSLTREVKIVVERHPDGFVAYPLGLQGVVVGEGDTYDEAIQDVTSAIRFHIETFGDDVLRNDSPVLDAFLTEAKIAV